MPGAVGDIRAAAAAVRGSLPRRYDASGLGEIAEFVDHVLTPAGGLDPGDAEALNLLAPR